MSLNSLASCLRFVHRDGVNPISDAETFLRPQVLSSTCWCSRSAATCRSSSTWTYRRTLALSPVYMESGQSRYFSVKTGSFETIMRNLTCVITLLIHCNIYFTRFLSICWVVLGHQYAYSIYLASNPTELPEVRLLLSSRCTCFFSLLLYHFSSYFHYNIPNFP